MSVRRGGTVSGGMMARHNPTVAARCRGGMRRVPGRAGYAGTHDQATSRRFKPKLVAS